MALLVKVTYIAIDKIAEPISFSFGAVAARSPAFQSSCRQLARAIGNMSSRGAPPPLMTDAEAAKAGAQILGEGVLWGVGLAVLAHESFIDRCEEGAQASRLVEYEQRILQLEHELEKWASRCAGAGRALPIEAERPAASRPAGPVSATLGTLWRARER
jgi:hypothetical protein